MEFTDLLAEVPDSSESAKAARRERARAWAKLRRERKTAELAVCIEWANYYEVLGKAQMDKNEFADAIESFQEAMAMVPARTLLREHVAFCYICLEEFETAKDLLLDILRDNPEEALAYTSLAAYYIRAEPNEEMVKKLLTRAIELDPAGSVEAHGYLAGMALKAGRQDDALAHYTAVLQQCPDCARPHYQRVTLCLENKRYAEASQAFAEMLEKVDLSEPDAAEIFEELKASFSMAPEPQIPEK